MPNQRKKGKHIVGSWIPEEMFMTLVVEAKRQGITRAKLLETLIERGLKGKGGLDKQ